MADAPYLVALTLLEVGGKRALPLSGKALSVAAAEALIRVTRGAPWPWS